MTLAALVMSLAVVLGYGWLTSSGTAAMVNMSAARAGTSLTGGTIWWP